MIILYRLLFLPGLLIGLPYYAWRMWRRGGYRKGFENRFGVMRNVPQKRNRVKRIWIQAVSVGELMAVEPLLKRLAENAAVEVVLTTTTSTGLKVLTGRLAPCTVWYGVFPLDFWLCSRRAWNRIQPDLAILMEGELWPEHIHQGRVRGVPVMLVNARLSDRSYRRHQSLRGLARRYLRSLDVILAGSPSDRDRLVELGWVAADRIRLTGNLKFDVPREAPPTVEEKQTLLREFGFGETPAILLLGSSTWPGEETALVDAWKELRTASPSLRLVIVPRHAERKPELQALFKASGWKIHFRSDGHQAPDGTDLYIADTTGELRYLTQFADIVFVGKSLTPNTGGQTPVEAAALGKPIIFGPEMSNFRDISRRLVSEGAARQVADAAELREALRRLLEDGEARLDMGRRADACIETSRGATERTEQEILQRLSL